MRQPFYRYGLALLAGLLLWPSVFSQDQLSLAERPDEKLVNTSLRTIEDWKKLGLPTSMNIGGYAIIVIKLPVKLKTHIEGDACIDSVLIPKGKEFKGWMVNKATGKFEYTTLAADKDYDRLWVTGTLKGTASVFWMTVKDGEPVVVASFKFIVAGGNPSPDVPPDDPVKPIPTGELADAAKADIKAGKGTATDLEAYASLYLMYGTEVKNGGAAYATVGDLNKEMNAKIDKLMGEDIEKTFPTLRRAVGKFLTTKAPMITQANTKMADARQSLSEALLGVYRQLDGVK